MEQIKVTGADRGQIGSRDFALLALGCLWGIGAAWWIVGEQWVTLALWVTVPVVFALVLRSPLSALAIWVLFAPICAQMYGDDTRWLNWLFSRLLFPTALGITLWYRVRKRTNIPFAPTHADFASVLFVALVFGLILLTDSGAFGRLISFFDLLMVPICAYWLLRLNPVTAAVWKQLAVVCGIALVVQVVIGVMAWSAPGLLPEEWLRLYGERTVGTLSRPAIFTSALTFFGIIVWAVSSRSPLRWVRAAGVACLTIALLAMVWSFSRGSWLAALAVFLGMVWIHGRSYRRALLMGTGVLLVIAVGLVLLNAAWAWERLTDLQTAEVRLVDQVASARMIAARPLLGWGYLQQNEFRPDFLQSVLGAPVVPGNPSHNTYLTMLAELGIPLFLLYMFPAVWWLRASWRGRKSFSSERRTLLALLWLVPLHILIVSNFTDVVSFHPVGTILWWLSLGLIADVATRDEFL